MPRKRKHTSACSFASNMSVSYAAAKMRIPGGFEHILEGLVREVLREQPEDVIAFSAEYFNKKILLRKGRAVCIHEMASLIISLSM